MRPNLVQPIPTARIAVASYGLICGCILLQTLVLTHRVVYSLDDPYIHLALAERIRQGFYGLNAGEFSSPSSSILWPFLLAPFTAFGFASVIPLIFNLLSGAACCWLVGSELDRWAPGTPRVRQIVLCTALAVGWNLPGLAFTGMEHSLQVLLAVAAALGMIRMWRNEPLPWWAVAAAAIGPLIRYENLAILGIFAVVAFLRNHRAAALLAATGVLPVILFSFFLHRHQHTWLPNSVLVKGSAFTHHGALSAIRYRVAASISKIVIIPETDALLAICGLLGWLIWEGRRKGAPAQRQLVLAAALLIGLIHIAAFPIGWFERYEMYCIAVVSVVALYALIERAGKVSSTALMFCGGLAAFYGNATLASGLGTLSIYSQQYQMHRLVHDYLPDAGIAVNDIGLVSFQRDPHRYMLDLFGLSSLESATATNKDAAWLESMTKKHQIDLVMIYPNWFTTAPPGWQTLGRLCGLNPPVTLGNSCVMLYSTRPADPALLEKLHAFSRSLPRVTTFGPADEATQKSFGQ